MIPSQFLTPKHWVLLDGFALLNLLLYLPLAVSYHYPKFLAYRGAGNLTEFYIYALALLALIAAIWAFLRRFAFPLDVLLLLQVTVLLHFAGGLLPVAGGRLYDWHWLPWGGELTRFDKVVHILNSFAVAYALRRMVPPLRQGILAKFLLVLCTLGLGALHELLEFSVALNVVETGVGTYINNMLDLAADFLGAFLATFLPQRWFPERSISLPQSASES